MQIAMNSARIGAHPLRFASDNKEAQPNREGWTADDLAMADYFSTVSLKIPYRVRNLSHRATLQEEIGLLREATPRLKAMFPEQAGPIQAFMAESVAKRAKVGKNANSLSVSVISGESFTGKSHFVEQLLQETGQPVFYLEPFRSLWLDNASLMDGISMSNKTELPGLKPGQNVSFQQMCDAARSIGKRPALIIDESEKWMKQDRDSLGQALKTGVFKQNGQRYKLGGIDVILITPPGGQHRQSYGLSSTSGKPFQSLNHFFLRWFGTTQLASLNFRSAKEPDVRAAMMNRLVTLQNRPVSEAVQQRVLEKATQRNLSGRQMYQLLQDTLFGLSV